MSTKPPGRRAANDALASLRKALAEGDAPGAAAAVGALARKHGMTRLAHQTLASRESLYRTLSANGNPELAPLIRVLRTLGLVLDVRPVSGADRHLVTLGASRLAQLQADLRLTPEQRVQAAALSAVPRTRRKSDRRNVGFERYRDYLAWKDGPRVHR